jgi:hypothetical protein
MSFEQEERNENITLFGPLKDDKKNYRSTAGAQHEYGMVCVNQKPSHSKN